MKPVRVNIVDIVGNIDIIPRTINTHPIPCVLNTAVCTCIAIDGIARDALASADGGEEAGEIVADARFGPQSFGSIRILIKAVEIIIIGHIFGDPSVCRQHLFFLRIPRCDFIVTIKRILYSFLNLDNSQLLYV